MRVQVLFIGAVLTALPCRGMDERRMQVRLEQIKREEKELREALAHEQVVRDRQARVAQREGQKPRAEGTFRFSDEDRRVAKIYQKRDIAHIASCPDCRKIFGLR